CARRSFSEAAGELSIAEALVSTILPAIDSRADETGSNARALLSITWPPVIVLDEPTRGLDPVSRVRMWCVIREFVAAGTSPLLTTQYLDEADELRSPPNRDARPTRSPFVM